MSAVGFAVGTGRCGTKFFAELLDRDRDIASSHERHPVSDTFHRYCQWYGIDADDAGFIDAKRRGIADDLSRASYSFEASGFLSLSVRALYERLDARILMLIRAPEKVVASYWRKGWYANDSLLDDPNKSPTFQNVAMAHHFFGRTMPIGAEYARWTKLTRVGKIAWYWARLNRALVEQAESLPREATRMYRIEDVDYAGFCDIRSFLGAPTNLSEALFAQVRRSKPNASQGSGTVHDWTALECAEFEAEVREMAEHLGYSWRTEAMREAPRARVKPGVKDRLRHAVRSGPF